MAEQKDRKFMELLSQKNKELEEFAYVASHDLQQPLRVLKGFTQLVESRLERKLDDEDKELIYYINKSVTNMQALIDDLLGYSRITTNVRQFTMANIKEIIDEAIKNLQPIIDETGTTFKFDNFNEYTEIYCDPIQMTQVFQNLFDNSIKYRKQNLPAVITISSRKTDINLIISVQDNGIGFDISHSERIFKIFQRLHSEDKYPGTGIGLSICKKIIERHDGIIWVESEEGVGTTFYIKIPLYDDKIFIQ